MLTVNFRTDAASGPHCATVVGKSLSGEPPRLGPIEPDMIGEFFVLETLRGDINNPLLDPPHPWMPAAAWRARAPDMLDFAGRAWQNFPDHPAMPTLLLPLHGVPESWFLRSKIALASADDLATGLQAAAEVLHDEALADVHVALLSADLTHLASHEAEQVPHGVVRKLLDGAAALARTHPATAELRAKWGSSVTNVVRRATAADAASCFELLEELAGLANAHKEEAVLRHEWSGAKCNYLGACCAHDWRNARSCVIDLKRATDAHEPELREAWARATFFYVSYHAAGDPIGSLSFLSGLKETLPSHQGEGVLREAWARGVTNFVMNVAALWPDACEKLLVELSEFADQHREESILLEQYGLAAYLRASAVARTDRARADDLIDRLWQRLEQDPDVLSRVRTRLGLPPRHRVDAGSPGPPRSAWEAGSDSRRPV